MIYRCNEFQAGCDGPDCKEENRVFTEYHWVESRAAFVRLLRRSFGWTRRGTEDFCPDCSTKRKAE